jgi:UDP-N-acetyl-D-glucosamine dehydrogenase
LNRLHELKARIASREARIGVIGLGYVGLPLAIEFARRGFRVHGFDLDASKVQTLQSGASYIEDIAGSLVAEATAAEKLIATTDFGDLSGCDVINVCVPTPLTRTKDPDVSHMALALEEIRKRLRTGQLIVLGSTTYPGTTHELFVPMLESTGLKVGVDFSVAFAPERIDPANKQFRLRDVPKVVGGETSLCGELATEVFSVIFERVVRVSSTQSAEMVKLLENTFRAINIGLANEIALMCNRLELDVWEVIEAAATKPYGFMKFVPGPGLGGHCIPVDPTYLAWKMKSLNFPARFIDVATEINGRMPNYVLERISDMLNQDRIAVNGARILVLGVAYKADVGDVRESPALDVMRLLLAKGAEVAYHDPYVESLLIEKQPFSSVELSDERLESCDLVVILTDHSAVDLGRVVSRAARVFDTRNATSKVEGAGRNVQRL